MISRKHYRAVTAMLLTVKPTIKPDAQRTQIAYCLANLFGDDKLKTAVLRLQFVYAWNAASENAKRLKQGH